MLIGFDFGARRSTSACSPRPARAVSEMWHVTTQTLTGFGHALTSSKARKQISSIVGITEDAHETVVAGAGYALVFLGFISLILAVINLFPFLPLDGGHVLWAVAEKVRGTADLAGRDVPLQLGRDRAAAVPRDQRHQQRHRPAGRLSRCSGTRTHTQLLTSGPKRSGRPGRTALRARRGAAARSPPSAGRAQRQ